MGYLDSASPKEMPDEVILKKSVSNPALFSILIDKYQLPFLIKPLPLLHSKH